MQLKLMPVSIPTLIQTHKFTISTLTTSLIMCGLTTPALATPEKNDSKDIIRVSSSPINTEYFAVAEQVEVIDAQAPEHQSATSALDLLKGQAGVFVSGAGSTYGQSVHMRGYDSRGVKITIDNVTQDFNSGLYDATFIDPTLVKTVYLHKGSGSLHHGNGALAGVVSIKTVNATDLLTDGQKLGGRLFSGINRNDHSYYAGATLLGRTDSLDFLLSYSQRKKYFSGTILSQDYDSNDKIKNWMLKTSWLSNPIYQVSLQLRDYNNDSLSLKQPTVLDTRQPKFKNTPHQRHNHQRDITVSQHFSPQNSLYWQADWDIYYTDLYLNQLDLVKVSEPYTKYKAEERNQYTYGTKFSNSFIVPVQGWFNNHIQSGVEYYQQQQKSNEHAISYPPAELSNTSGWLANDITLQSVPITLSAGTRFTQYQASRKNFPGSKQNNWSSRFAISATPMHWLNIHSSYSEAYRTPRMAELYNNSNHFKIPFIGTSSVFRPSPDLKPEKNKTIEVGTKFSFDDLAFSGDALQFGTTYFHTKAKDHLVVHGRYTRSYGVWFPHEIYYINIPSATIYGFDSFIHYKTHWFDLNITHNRTVGKEDGTNHSLSSLRPETTHIRLNAPISSTGLSVGWVGEFAAKTAFTGSSEYKLPHHRSEYGLDRNHREIVQFGSYSLHDFYVNYNADQFIKGLNSSLTMKNAFDKQYVSSMGVPQEGRNFYFNVNYTW